MVIISVLFFIFGCRAPVNEFSFGAKGFRQRAETLSTINKEISKAESKIQKIQSQNQSLLAKAERSDPAMQERYLETISSNEEVLEVQNQNLVNLFESKNRLINNFIESDGGIYSGNMNPRKIRAAAEAYATLSFIKNKETNRESVNLKGIFINKSYYDVNVKVFLGKFWSTEFNLLRKDGIQEVELPSYGDYTVVLTKGTGAGTASSMLIKSCKPGVTYLNNDFTYDLMVTCLR